MNEGSNSQHGKIAHGDEINLFDYYKVIKRYRKMIAAIVASASVIAVIVSLLLPKYYKSEAVIIPVSASGGGGGLSALASQFGGLASLAGINLPGGSGGDAEKLVAILRSRTLTENVIKHENLMPVLFEDQWDPKAGKWKAEDPDDMPNMEMAVKKMKGAVSIVADKEMKTAAIKISAEFRSPDIAAGVANAYIEELQNFINENAFTTAKRNRLFIEEQLAQNKIDLLEAGKEINVFYKTKAVSSVESDLDVNIGEVYDVEEVISDKEKLAAIQTGSDAAMKNLIAEKAEIERKMAEVRTVKDVPQQVYLTYMMLRRELLAKVNALLTTQYEMAKIEETKEDLAFQVIDSAVPPIMRAWPRRAQICIMSFFAALFFAVFLAFFREYLARMKAQMKERG